MSGLAPSSVDSIRAILRPDGPINLTSFSAGIGTAVTVQLNVVDWPGFTFTLSKNKIFGSVTAITVFFLLLFYFHCALIITHCICLNTTPKENCKIK